MPGLEKTYPADLPAAQGHFPGNPIIPGAYLLSDALAEVAAQLGWQPGTCSVKNAKFLAPCRPGDQVHIDYSAGGDGKLKLLCTVAGNPVLSAQVLCPPSPTPA